MPTTSNPATAIDNYSLYADRLEAHYGLLDEWLTSNGYSRNESDVGSRKLWLTIFKDQTASEKLKGEYTLLQWADIIRNTNADSKDKLQWLKGAIFGDKLSANGSYRTNENVEQLTAIVVEHDAGTISFDEAMSTVSKAGLRVLGYTSPSYRQDNQKWRLIFPLSHYSPKERHDVLVAMVNGLFGGQLSPESFVLSQSYYFGSVNSNPAHRVEIVDGQFLDLADRLFAGRMFKHGDKDETKPRKREKIKNPNFYEAHGEHPLPRADLDEIIFALRYTPADNYLMWRDVGAALADELGDEGRTIFHEWSATSEKYDEEQCEKKWQDFSEMTEIGIGTLFNWTTKFFPTWREAFHRKQREQRGDDDQTEDASKPPPKDKKPAIEMYWHGINYDRALRPWLIDKLIPQTGTGLASGQWGSGKTFVTLDLAGSVITGLRFAGREVSRRGGVMFIAAEGGNEITIRLEGLVGCKLAGEILAATASGNAIDADINGLPFVWIEECPSLKRKIGLKQLTEMVINAAAQMKERFGLDLALIVIDTLSSAADFNDQNDAAEGQAVMNILSQLSRVSGAFVLAVDHFGKDATSGTRGTSAKEAAVDVVLAILADKDVNGTVTNTRMAVRKLRGGKTGEETPFQLEVVEISNEDEEETETTCTVVWEDTRVGAAEPSKRIPKGLKIFHAAMTIALLDHGAELRPLGDEGPLIRAVAEPKLRDEFMASYPADNLDAKGKAYRRALKDAREQGLIGSRTVVGVDQIWFIRDLKKKAG